jgi:hypothetical protein
VRLISEGSSQMVAGDFGGPTPDMFTDAELTALALAADPHQPLNSDAVPMSDYLSSEKVGLLPEWYMAPVMTRHIRRVPQLIALVVIGAFLLIEAVGLCSTYGQLPFH